MGVFREHGICLFFIVGRLYLKPVTGHLLVKMVRWTANAASMLEPGKPNVLSLDDVLQSMHMPHTISLRDWSPDRPVNPYWGRGPPVEVGLSLKMSGEALEFDSRPRLGSSNVPSSRPTSMIDERGQKSSEYSWVCQRELDFKLQLQASGLGDMYCLKNLPPRRRKESTATIFHSSLPRQPATFQTLTVCIHGPD